MGIMSARQIVRMFEIWQRNNPHPTTELVYHSDFQLLIAVMLSAQTTDIMVNKVTAKLFPVAGTPEAILSLGVIKLQQYIKSIGLFRTKAHNVISTCKLLLDRFAGKVPSTRAELESLPGVGRKTANVILNTLWGEPTIAVDTHIFRVANHIGLTKAANRLDTELQLLRVIPSRFRQHAHHWLILHGRYVCKASKPACADCVVMELCQFDRKLVSSNR